MISGGRPLGRQWLGVLIECLPLGSFCHTENLAILGGFARCALVGVAVGQRIVEYEGRILNMAAAFAVIGGGLLLGVLAAFTGIFAWLFAKR